MRKVCRISLFFWLIAVAFSPCAWAALTFEGFLREVKVFRVSEASDGGAERIVEKKFALLLAAPREVAVPSGLFQKIFFILLEMNDTCESFVDKHVKVEGKWKGLAFPFFESVFILKVDQISEDYLKNKDDLDEEAISSLEECLPVMAEAACRLARWQALASGCKILQVEENKLIEIGPEGTETRYFILLSPILLPLKS